VNRPKGLLSLTLVGLTFLRGKPVTVKRLKELLAHLPDDAEVCTYEGWITIVKKGDLLRKWWIWVWGGSLTEETANGVRQNFL
jgi:hypothetical protein